MPAKRKTSLSLVCFYALFVITSCVNSKKNRVTFQSRSEETTAEVSVLNRTDASITIQLTCISKAKNIDIKSVSIKCLNPNPVGLNNVNVLDTADSKPVQIYNSEYNGNVISVIVPYGNLDKTNRDLILRIVGADKANLELKLVKSRVADQPA